MNEYAAEYKRKLMTPQDAAARVRSGDTLVHGLSAAEPPALLAAIAERARAGDLKDIKVHSLLPLRHAAETLLAPDLRDAIRAYSWFVSGLDRSRVKEGLDHFVPNYFHQVPRLFREFVKIDVTVTTVSPMDKAGYFTFGTANDYTSTAARHCRLLMVEVNRNMPRVFGDSILHVSEVDAVVENHVPLQEAAPVQPGPEDEAIAKSIADMVPDGATLQLGWGGIPNAATRYLTGHKDLGIHTELFCSGMAELIEKGVVTGRRKTIHPRKSIFTVAFGTKETYEFIHDNPALESHPVSYTNDPAVIAQNDNFIAINSIIEVDLLGQCNAESLAGFEYSGTGGQVDFMRGAFNSRGGKAILAFHSTAKGGEVSRVVPRLEEGAVVTTPRMDTEYLVTEHGVVNLKAKSTRERALDIISIAHPGFRDGLLKEAEAMRLL